jgi:uncharacterized membrane protein
MGVGFLYRGLAAGRMGVIAPVSAIGSALLPVVVGVALGERPGTLVWAGVVLAVPGVWLVASGTDDQAPSEPATRGLLDGILAGVGFGLFFVSIGQVPAGGGVAPLAVAQGSALLCLVGLALVTRSAWVPRSRTSLWGLAAGTIGAASAGAFLAATQSGLLTVVAVLSALYPAVTVVLAVVVLRERVLRSQAVGLALCVATMILVASG